MHDGVVYDEFVVEVDRRACPDLDDAQQLARWFAVMQSLNRDALVLAYHDRSDGGAFAAVCEMAFAGRVGVTLNLDLFACDAAAHEVQGNAHHPELSIGRDLDRVLAALFAEELGALIQISVRDRERVLARLRESALQAYCIGSPNTCDEIRLVRLMM